ncbi:Helix-turn-helix protein [Desulfitobacterium dichloroeliminans LMG P-21439]|uniref:Helix-turn-helix protein n=1 Tax=Desulfitobacterium dichloroeliminans (strain LMG P-21439 / DCA1) TaxID=871963 RepID=L0F651_DESDL|nr:helix-turn-helix transcriptional regulator [Desulfitobacterium dichloroeliminans]AGA68438.1 Helix-turn-helix protein [Desulfitobacterium dichloroeliminans LMG P-21439]
MVALGDYLSVHRVAQKISIRKLASLANLSHTEIYRLENGERKHPSPNVLKSIALALHLNYNELMKVAGYLDESSTSEGHSRREINVKDLTELELEEVEKFIEYLRHKRRQV